uniref:Secreted protein n=1 Tax=Chromera velia CCMP2878 TaxID=1169474 RepID=A0A0K6S800_9ALVE|eukprot:Cvel_22188.t1-p1 / transcript=Cvel_22188.t1 / gene=Cvel_22188 / organism=Chromera_velia_CCMP2878 / gene_product=hypothetical protein / transcript_product=hypothetical protein / location=Cvel_scaffold2155:2830-4352(-) / protein_length=82 / sequence_SO=supercontig / SO=protein_coding / is_pseudo=false
MRSSDLFGVVVFCLCEISLTRLIMGGHTTSDTSVQFFSQLVAKVYLGSSVRGRRLPTNSSVPLSCRSDRSRAVFSMVTGNQD